MKKLYHYPLCPFSRQIRIYLKELEVPFTLITEEYWQNHAEFLAINPAGNLPVFEEPYGLIIAGIYPVTEYLNDKYPAFHFMDEDSDIRCEIRRLLSWFNDKFYYEVTRILLREKITRLKLKAGGPRTDFIRAAKANLVQHLAYLSHLLEARSFIASDKLSCADIAAGCHLSVLDYLGEINWDKWFYVKQWYAILKSRPSFRPLLQDRITGFPPSACYIDLDF